MGREPGSWGAAPRRDRGAGALDFFGALRRKRGQSRRRGAGLPPLPRRGRGRAGPHCHLAAGGGRASAARTWGVGASQMLKDS